jgi:DNA invertase Pin-like site-specific DNA recombinase
MSRLGLTVEQPVRPDQGACDEQGQRIGYVRVSTVEQNTERQLDGVEVDRTFTDKASGKDTQRPQLKAALEYARDGDTLLVHSMDRLAATPKTFCVSYVS